MGSAQKRLVRVQTTSIIVVLVMKSHMPKKQSHAREREWKSFGNHLIEVVERERESRREDCLLCSRGSHWDKDNSGDSAKTVERPPTACPSCIRCCSLFSHKHTHKSFSSGFPCRYDDIAATLISFVLLHEGKANANFRRLRHLTTTWLMFLAAFWGQEITEQNFLENVDLSRPRGGETLRNEKIYKDDAWRILCFD